MENLGNQLNRILNEAKHTLFDQGELAQLTHGAFDIAARAMQESKNEEIDVSFPVGYRADKTTIESKRTYKKEDLLGRYQYLAFHQLSINAIVQIVTIVEAAINDVVRATVLRYPKKLGAKRSIPMKTIFESTSIEEIHVRATDSLINELSYKSPVEFAESLKSIIPVNLMECHSFHKYVEVKATRDIFIHNRGIANDIYTRKSGTHSRVNAGGNLPCNIQYFLESYEASLQMMEWLENQLHQHWHSSENEDRQQKQQKSSFGEAEAMGE